MAVTLRTLQQCKTDGTKFSVLTAYDATFAHQVSSAGIGHQAAGDITGHALKQQHVGAGGFKRLGIGNHLGGGVLLAALYPVAAKGVDALRGQAHMGADRHAVALEHRYGVRQPACAFELDQVGAGRHHR